MMNNVGIEPPARLKMLRKALWVRALDGYMVWRRKGEQLLSFMMILGALRRTVHYTVEKLYTTVCKSSAVLILQIHKLRKFVNRAMTYQPAQARNWFALRHTLLQKKWGKRWCQSKPRKYTQIFRPFAAFFGQTNFTSGTSLGIGPKCKNCFSSLPS